MVDKPIIGLTVGHMFPATDAGRAQDAVVGCSVDYCREIEQAGGVAVLLPPVVDMECVERLVGMIDGLLLTGGGDLSPEILDEDPHPRIRAIDPSRDATEIVLIQGCAKRRVPILGICKGAQILNVALGGGLVQHIDDSTKDAIAHWQAGGAAGPMHNINIVHGTLLARLLGERTARVNSYHHQAIGAVAPGLTVSARSADQVVEAVESSQGEMLLGVQFHPEKSARTDPGARALFEWLVRQASVRHLSRVRPPEPDASPSISLMPTSTEKE